MTAKRLGWVKAAALAIAIAFSSAASTVHAEETPAPSAAAPASSEAPAPSAPSAEAPPKAASQRTAWPWIVMGTGVALIVTAGVLQIRSVSEDDKRESEELKLVSLPAGDPQRKTIKDSVAAHDESASSSRTASLIVGTVGFLTVAGAVAWWFFEGGSSASSTPAAAKAKPTFTPSFAPGYAGASLGTSF